MQRPHSRRDRWYTAVTATPSRSTCSTHSSDALLLGEGAVNLIAHQVGQVIGQVVKRLAALVARTRQIHRKDGRDAPGASREHDDAVRKRDGFVVIVRYDHHR